VNEGERESTPHGEEPDSLVPMGGFLDRISRPVLYIYSDVFEVA
jgi:hypothetical protein